MAIKRRTSIGQRREQITIMTVSTSPFGAHSLENSYTEKYVLRARVRQELNRLPQEKGGIGYDVIGERTHIVVFRNGNYDIDNTNMVLWRGAYYKIIAGPEAIGITADSTMTRYMRLDMKYDSDVGTFANPAPESDTSEPLL